MKHYKDPNTNEIYAYESDGSQDEYIKEGLLPITIEEAEQLKISTTQAEFNALSYAEKRALEYPDFREYLDGVVKGDQTQIDDYVQKCLTVKAKYPKD